ncbi:sensor histidine kinase [Paenibacillus silvisoli]|uniref:sensor histidine kinase n=1 Tax=Paenibacillus silvisoli TaxID=3110539 RepID=UPI0028050EAF|nr:histidine kinase [Paenibacillus silvisoli]
MIAKKILQLFNQNIKHFSIYTKLVTTLFLVVIPLYGINFFVNELGANRNKAEISKSFENTVHTNNKILENEFQRIMRMLNQTGIDTALLYINQSKDEMTDVERTKLMIDFRNLLDHFRSSSTFIEEARALLPAIGKTISTNTNSYLAEVNQDELTSMQQEDGPGPFIQWQNRLFLSKSYRNALEPSSRLFVLEAEINQYQIKIVLNNMMSFGQSGAVLLSTKDDWEIASRSNPEVLAGLKAHLRGNPVVDSTVQLSELTIDHKKYVVAFEKSAILNTILAVYVPEEVILQPLDIYRSLFWTMSLLSLFAIIICSYLIYRVIHRPLKKLVESFRKVEKGNLNVTIKHVHNDEFGYLYDRFNYMVGNLGVLIDEVYEQKIRNQRSELKRLQSQISPHFLYNNFFILYRLIQSQDMEKSSKFAQYLGRYFQFITRDASDEIRLELEYEHARTYVEIQTICYSKRVDVEFEPLPEPYKDHPVIRLIYQPIIENSYKYAFENKVEGGKLVIGFEAEDGFFSFIVEDNGASLTEEDLQRLNERLSASDNGIDDSTGLINVHRRIRIKYGPASGVFLSRSKLGGMKAVVKLLLKS